jgi:PAS domain S-box-containing protein
MPTPADISVRFARTLGRPFVGVELFDAVPDTVFFLKDASGRYVAVNETLVARTGRARKADLIGRTAAEVFSGDLGRQIGAQDLAVIRTGVGVAARLELHLYADGSEGWCLTWKTPLSDANGRIVGLAGISRDLQPAANLKPDLAAIARIVDYIHAHLDEALPLSSLAERARLTPFQLNERMRGLFGVSTVQFQTRARINHACALLKSAREPIADVALQCGYADQAAFTRAFKKAVGLTPSQYQKRRG